MQPIPTYYAGSGRASALSPAGLASSLSLFDPEVHKANLALAEVCKSSKSVCHHGPGCAQSRAQIDFVDAQPDASYDELTRFSKSFLKCWRGHKTADAFRSCGTCAATYVALSNANRSAGPPTATSTFSATIPDGAGPAPAEPLQALIASPSLIPGLASFASLNLVDYDDMRLKWSGSEVCRSIFSPTACVHGTNCSQAKAQIAYADQHAEPGPDELTRELKRFLKCWRGHAQDVEAFQNCGLCKVPYKMLPAYLVPPGAKLTPPLPLPVLPAPLGGAGTAPPPLLPWMQPGGPGKSLSVLPGLTAGLALSAAPSLPLPSLAPGLALQPSVQQSTFKPLGSLSLQPRAQASSALDRLKAGHAALKSEIDAAIEDFKGVMGKLATDSAKRQQQLEVLRKKRRVAGVQQKFDELSSHLASRESIISAGFSTFADECKRLQQAIDAQSATSDAKDSAAHKALIEIIEKASAELLVQYNKQLQQETDAIAAVEAAESALAEAMAAGENGKILSDLRRQALQGDIAMRRQQLGYMHQEGVVVQASLQQKLDVAVGQLQSASSAVATTNVTIKQAAAAVIAAAEKTAQLQQSTAAETHKIASIHSDMAKTQAAHNQKLAQLATEMRELIETNAFLNGRLPAEDAVYVIDASGSMSSSTRWGRCSEFLRKAFTVHKRLREEGGRSDRIGAVVFTTTAYSLNGVNTLVDATPSNIAALVGQLGSQGPGGGTQIIEGVTLAAGFGASELYLLSDCEDWIDEGRYLSVLKGQKLHVCFCASSQYAAALQGVATATGGTVADVSSLMPKPTC